MEHSPIRVAQIMGIMNNGGVEAVVMNYYRALNRSRVQFDFFVDETCSFPQREEIERLGGRCYLVPAYSRPVAFVCALVRRFRENRYTIVHSQINTMGLFPLFAAWLAGVPVRICHNHSTAHPGEGKKTLMKKFLRPFARLFANRYFACGDTAARWMYGNQLVDSGRVYILPNAITLSRYAFSADDRASIRAEVGAGTSTRIIGHIGRFTFTKNHAFLLEAFHALHKQHADALLLLAGEGETQAAIQALAKSLGIEDSVRFLGVRADANRLYSAMDVFCLPSFYEGLPVVMVEALANGLSCVVSDRVTRELNAYPVTALSLEDNAERWSEVLCAIPRTERMPEGLAAQFNIAQTAAGLEQYYLEQAV